MVLKLCEILKLQKNFKHNFVNNQVVLRGFLWKQFYIFEK